MVRWDQKTLSDYHVLQRDFAKLTAERDALTERVRVREAFVAAWDAFEANPTILNRVRLEQARAAIDAQGETQ